MSRPPRIGSLFSGYGGLDLAVGQVLGAQPVWHAEIDAAPAAVLAHRFPDVPNLGDVTAVDWAAVEPVEILAGGFPCQDVSAAGRRAGIRPGTRSGLWSHFAYAIDQLRPGLVLIENVRGLLSADAHHPAHRDLEPCPWCVGDRPSRPLRALGAVLGELADLGYDASWQGLRASDVGAPHSRFRVFVLAWPADPDRAGGEGRRGRPRPAGAPGRGLRPGPDDGRTPAAAHAAGDRRDQRRTEPAGVLGGPDAALSGDAAAWGDYRPAIRAWERLTRPAPAPTEPTARGTQRLSPRFVEWMMGLPAGWVTDVPGLTRNAQLKALGNGVVPQQAAAALGILLPDAVAEESAA